MDYVELNPNINRQISSLYVQYSVLNYQSTAQCEIQAYVK